jgi:hypothetical protein
VSTERCGATSANAKLRGSTYGLDNRYAHPNDAGKQRSHVYQPPGLIRATIGGGRREINQSINQSELFGYDRELMLSRDPSTRQNVVKIISKSTGETIAQLPAEVVLQMQAYLQQR